MSNSIDKKVEEGLIEKGINEKIDYIPFFKRVELSVRYIGLAIGYNKKYGMNLPLFGISRKRARVHIA
jgi:hypothetical protein